VTGGPATRPTNPPGQARSRAARTEFVCRHIPAAHIAATATKDSGCSVSLASRKR